MYIFFNLSQIENTPGGNISYIDESVKDSEICVDDISLFTKTSKSLTDEEKLKVIFNIGG